MANVATTEEFQLFSDRNPNRRARRLSAPEQGMSLEAVTAVNSKGLREAVAKMAAAFSHWDLTTDFQTVFGPRYCGSALPAMSPARIAQRTAWNLACVWLLRRHALGEKRGLVEAEDWFRATAPIPAPRFSEALPSETRWLVEQQLYGLPIDTNFWDLLPYLLEEHGIGSRASVMRDPATAQARDAKRKDGVYPTPSDVAEYMVRHCLRGAGGMAHERLCLDPACGTGVFFLALLHAAKHSAATDFDCFEYASLHLHGLDVSGHALDACAFVLLYACWSDVERRGLSPWSAWHRLRMNLVQADALTVQPWRATDFRTETKTRFSAIAKRLTEMPSTYVEPDGAALAKSEEVFGLFGNAGKCLQDLFPIADRGFNILVGNPPYAALGKRADMVELAGSFRALPDSSDVSRANLFPLFIEMMWRFTSPGSAAALVTPLSIAYHGGTQYENCRRAMSTAGGRWQFAFFDRQPHALFGEEVKTRNTILFRFEDMQTPPRGQLAEIETGPLRKWTSRTRHALFDSITFTTLGPSVITHGIPKLGGEIQAATFRVLQHSTARFPAWCVRMGTSRPEAAIGEQDAPRVFIGGTAYNFLNVYRCGELAEQERSFPLSESAVHCLEFRSEQDAEAAFAILSSRLTFMFWHVLGDGFHVPGWLWREIPFSRALFDADSLLKLAALGRVLWLRLRGHRFTSLNGGKLTIGYRPLNCHEERDAIDALLLHAAGLPRELLGELRSFVQSNTVVDTMDERRQHLNCYFSSTTHP